jgi:hypothetical protein
MGRIRPFVIDDIGAVARLYQKTFGDRAKSPDSGFRGYLEQLFFGNPCVDPDVPPLICQDDDGSIIGFLGVLCRRMVFKGRAIRVAVSTSFMVDPDRRRTLAGVHLQRAFFAGPQDLSMTDGANDASRILWEQFGGITVPLYSLWWTRVLNPSRYALEWCATKRGWCVPFAMLFKPLAMALDRVAASLPPNDFVSDVPETAVEELDTKTLLECIGQSSASSSLKPEYDLHSLAWVLDMASQKKVYGSLWREVVRNVHEDIIGWYLYYQNPNSCSQVLEFWAIKNSVHQVLHHLFRSAWRGGSLAVSGRIEPMFIREVSEQYCRIHSGTWMLAYSRDADILHSICRGDAFLGRLEGEWWLRVHEFVH